MLYNYTHTTSTYISALMIDLFECLPLLNKVNLESNPKHTIYIVGQELLIIRVTFSFK